jgi:hypothetical protein
MSSLWQKYIRMQWRMRLGHGSSLWKLLDFQNLFRIEGLRSSKRLSLSVPQRGENAIWLSKWPFGLEARFRPIPSCVIIWSSFLMPLTAVLSMKFCVCFQNFQNARLFTLCVEMKLFVFFSQKSFITGSEQHGYWINGLNPMLYFQLFLCHVFNLFHPARNQGREWGCLQGDV